MKKYKYIVLDEDDNTEYVIKVKHDITNGKVVYKMYRTKGEQWTEQAKGEKLFTLVDNDMNVSIKMHDNKFKDHQYHQTMELRILLNLVNDRSSGSDKYKTVLIKE